MSSHLAFKSTDTHNEYSVIQIKKKDDPTLARVYFTSPIHLYTVLLQSYLTDKYSMTSQKRHEYSLAEG